MEPSSRSRSRALAKRGRAKDAGIMRVVDRVGPGRSMALGLGLVAAGVASAVAGVDALLAVVATSAAMTMGAGLFAMGLFRATRPEGTAQAPAGPSAAVLEERARRIRRLMHEGGGAWTFELLAARLGWTERAVAEALAYMRDRGEIAEDLDLETGKWVYRPASGEPGETSAVDLTLDDRLRRLRDED